MKVLIETCDVCGAETKMHMTAGVELPHQTAVVGYRDVCSVCVERAVDLVCAEVEDGKWRGSKRD